MNGDNSNGMACVRLGDVRFSKIRSALVGVLRARSFSGQDMEKVLGRLLQAMLLFRRSLSILWHCYIFIHDSYLRKQPLWDSVRREILLALRLLPMFVSWWFATFV